jgi:hypothetical protein
MPKVLVLTGDAAESLEVMYPYQRLLEEGYEVDIAAPTKKKLQFVVHDFVEGYDTYTEKPGYTWDADLASPRWTHPRIRPLSRRACAGDIRNDPAFAPIVEHFFRGEARRPAAAPGAGEHRGQGPPDPPPGAEAGREIVGRVRGRWASSASGARLVTTDAQSGS